MYHHYYNKYEIEFRTEAGYNPDPVVEEYIECRKKSTFDQEQIHKNIKVIISPEQSNMRDNSNSINFGKK